MQDLKLIKFMIISGLVGRGNATKALALGLRQVCLWLYTYHAYECHGCDYKSLATLLDDSSWRIVVLPKQWRHQGLQLLR